MAILGIEGTAHTLGAGVVEDDGGKCRVLSNVRDMLMPEEGGIHPREAAHHHAEVGPDILQRALDEANVTPADLDGVAFSQGPGLGPCLRVAATMARAFALRHDLPLVGVNHCVAHLEIGTGLTDATDPVLLYASGANTQVIAHVRGRYRVFGETLDVGIGNGLDKFARENGMPFPGGPKIEQLAKECGPEHLHPLPYTVKGMDMSFSGLAIAAQRLIDKGVPLNQVCYSVQEHAFAALVEVAERALAHTQKDELVLGGGVACNQRLQDMAREMVEARGGTYHCPPRPVLVDNGTMIAWMGHLKLQADGGMDVADTGVLPYQRTDHIDVTWRADGPVRHTDELIHGAEARVSIADGRILKDRVVKGYRHSELDARLRAERTRDEANLIVHARKAGVPVPVITDLDRGAGRITMQRIDGPALRQVLPADADDVAADRLRRLGTLVGRLHDAGLSHGDLTTSNVLVPRPTDPQSMVLIDFGLGQFSQEAEPRGVDLHLVEEALAATDARAEALMEAFLQGYGGADVAPAAMRRLEDIRLRGRYREAV